MFTSGNIQYTHTNRNGWIDHNINNKRKKYLKCGYSKKTTHCQYRTVHIR